MRFVEDVEVTGVLQHQGSACGVVTAQGVVRCETVVNCAGRWADLVGGAAVDHDTVLAQVGEEVGEARQQVAAGDHQVHGHVDAEVAEGLVEALAHALGGGVDVLGPRRGDRVGRHRDDHRNPTFLSGACGARRGTSTGCASLSRGASSLAGRRLVACFASPAPSSDSVARSRSAVASRLLARTIVNTCLRRASSPERR